MKQDTFCFTKHRTIAIYGGNENGIHYYRKLVAEGYYIQCFIDKNAKETNGMLVIDKKKIPIYEPEKVFELDLGTIIFIAVRNAVEQTNIAKQLFEKNFENIIFYPLIKENKHNAKFLNMLKAFYKEFIAGKIRENAVLPKQKLLWETNPFWDHAIIEQNNKYVVAWVPISIIHYYTITQMEELINIYGITVGTEEKNFDKSIYQLKWLNDLFDFFICGQGNLDYYWEVERVASNYIKRQSNKENQLWFSDRQNCVEILMTGMNIEKDFMVKSAIPVQWNKRGYFNICDGGHRLAFFNCMNISMVPTIISLDEYTKWINSDVLNDFLRYIQEMNIRIFDAPIPHPWFYGCEVIEEKFGKTILKCVLERLIEFDLYDKFSVLDTNPKEGYYLQHFARISTDVIRGIVSDKNQYDLLLYVNRLFYLEDHISLVSMETEKKSKKKYDIVLILKKICELTKAEQIKYIKWVSTKTRKMIVWESGVEYEEEKKIILQHSSFKKYISLKRVLSQNIVREVGIFLKEIN